jgi:hypothetical protein
MLLYRKIIYPTKGRQPKASHALKEQEQTELLLDSFFPQKKFNKRHAQTMTTQFRIYTQNSQERKRRRRRRRRRRRSSSRGFCCLLIVPTKRRRGAESRHQRSKEKRKQGEIYKREGGGTKIGEERRGNRVWVGVGSRKHFRRLELRVDYTAASRVYKEVIVEKKKGWLMMVVCEGACKQKQTCAMRQNQSSAHTAATDTERERER